LQASQFLQKSVSCFAEVRRKEHSFMLRRVEEKRTLSGDTTRAWCEKSARAWTEMRRGGRTVTFYQYFNNTNTHQSTTPGRCPNERHGNENELKTCPTAWNF
jgi:hypothetical protein